MALHTCDVKRCVNWRHVYEGTAKENIRDVMERGQWSPPPSRRGDMNNQFGRVHGTYEKVSWNEVSELRRLRGRGWTLKDLAARYGLGISQVHRIVTWENRLVS